MKIIKAILVGTGLTAIGMMFLLALAEDVAASPELAPQRPLPPTYTITNTYGNSYSPSVVVNCNTNANIVCQNPGPQHAPGSAFDNS